MVQGRKPTVFVSSTCYDLKQIRNDVKKVIEDDLGFEALLSEYSSFPIDPSLGTVENCLRVVEQRADIFLLVVGSRYGSIARETKSVTNLEYLRAKAKNIPIYVFIDKKIMNSISLWRDNPDMDFSSIVDTPKLFEFVDEIMSVDGVWVHEYELSSEISHRFKTQLSFLFFDSLEICKSLKSSVISPKVLLKSPSAIQIVLEKPLGWEYLFFSQIFSDEIEKCKETRKDLRYQLFLDFTTPITNYGELFSWAYEKYEQLLRGVKAFSSLINEAFPIAIGKPGVKSDLDFLVYIVDKIGVIYKRIIDLQINIFSTTVPEEANQFVKALGKSTESLIDDIERIQREVADAFSKIPFHNSNSEIIREKIPLELSILDTTEVILELEKLSSNDESTISLH